MFKITVIALALFCDSRFAYLDESAIKAKSILDRLFCLPSIRIGWLPLRYFFRAGRKQVVCGSCANYQFLLARVCGGSEEHSRAM